MIAAMAGERRRRGKFKSKVKQTETDAGEDKKSLDYQFQCIVEESKCMLLVKASKETLPNSVDTKEETWYGFNAPCCSSPKTIQQEAAAPTLKIPKRRMAIVLHVRLVQN